MLLRQIFDPYLAQYAYLIGCQKSGEALVIDPERDIDRYKEIAAQNGLRITAVAETHIHADFVSGAREFSTDPAVRLYLSDEGGPQWRYRWAAGRSHTRLLKDGEEFKVGNILIKALHTPGHTPEHLSFLITDAGADEPMALATGDFLFVGDVGRPDLLESAAGEKDAMEPSARTLRHALVNALAPYADFLQVLPAHGAGSACGKALGAVPTSTLGYERRFNQALRLAQSSETEFVKDILHGQPNPPLYFSTMKRVNRDGPQLTGTVPLGRELSAAALLALRGTEHLVILDTRMDRAAFDAGHIEGAIYAPLHSSFFSMAAGSFLNEQSKIVVVVAEGTESQLAARQLYRIGLDGLLGWIPLAEAQKGGLCTAKSRRIDFVDFDPVAARREGEIVDVRTSAEFDQQHLEGAHSLPYTRMQQMLRALPPGRTLYVHCASGKRAALATSFLRSQGFDAVHVDGLFSTCGQRVRQ
ncbi:MAG: MBL fold metallo-hydrolase [Proteobacteria bacterium]|nr:MBL fold metallo-hydrolase [Pseudomonadota bacterium]